MCLAQTNPCNDCITPDCMQEYDDCMNEPACASSYQPMLACVCAGQNAMDQAAIDKCLTSFDNASNSGAALDHCIDMNCNVECGF